MEKKVLDFGSVGCDRLKPSLVLGVPLTPDWVSGPQAKEFHPVNDPHFQFGFVSFDRETYVCFLSVRETVGSRHDSPENDGPLFHAEASTGQRKREQGSGTVDNGSVRKVNPRTRSAHPRDNGPLNWYLLSQELRTDENRVPNWPTTLRPNISRCV